RVRAVPAREGVGRETRMDHAEGRDHRLVVQVGVEGPELRGIEHALVDEGLEREAREVKALGARHAGRARGANPPLADDAELSFKAEAVRVAQVLAATDED